MDVQTRRDISRTVDVAEAVATRKDRFVKRFVLNSSLRNMCYL